MQQKIDFGVSPDGKHVVQRVTAGPTQIIMAIPLGSIDQVVAGLQAAKREAAGKIVVSGKGIEFTGSTTLPEECSEQKGAES